MKDHQNHPQNQHQDHQNRLQGLQNPTYKEHPQGGLLIGEVLKPLKPILVVLGLVLGVVLVVLHEAQRQCSEQTVFGTVFRAN